MFTLTADVVVGSVAPAQAGAAAGLCEASTELGGALGVAVLGSLMTFVYRLAIAEFPELADLPMSVAMGSGAAGLDLQPARAALGQALHVSALVCGAVALAGAGLALLVLARHSNQEAAGEAR